ncbi:MAG: S41 family peptidase [Oscillospiraceae bacterium]
MNKKISLGAAIAFMAILAGITFCITMMVSLNHFNEKVLNVKAREEMYKKLSDVDRNARQNFSGTINEEVLADSLSAGYIRGLGDKYSSYLTKDEYEQKMLELSGKLVQIGVTVQKDQTGYAKITKIMKGSPAEQAGMIVGDLIVSIGDADLKAVTLVNIERLLKGEVGTKLNVVYRRDGVDTQKDIQRKDIEIKYVEYRLMGANGYIKIIGFNDKTYNQFKNAVDDLVRQGADAFVFDLRNNNSDSIEAANSMLNMLLPAGELGTKKNNAGEITSLGSSDKYELALPMATIINGKTGNAAEYFVAVLRDFKKATSTGTISFGKAVIQKIFQINDGSAINITTEHFLPPSGAEINGVGIKPDYEVKLTPEQEQGAELLTDETDPQIQKAIEIVNSKKEA